MPAVFVHGNPETPAVWDPLRSHLSRTDVVSLQLPGFGTPAAPGWSASKDDYVAWLADQLERIGEPVDLVGHDWGGGFALRVATTRPDLLRSWVTDVAGMFDPDFAWHGLAQIWQTPEAGEAFFGDQLKLSTDEKTQQLESFGITPDAARSFAEAADDEMARCILALYRSATSPELRAWSDGVAAAANRPGLVLAPDTDPFSGGPELSIHVASLAGAQHQVLSGLGHWWMLEDPSGSAALLESFWLLS